MAEQLEEVGFKSFDAMHIACAESEKADVFLTTDDKLLKLTKRNKNKLNVDIANPVLWLTERLFVAVNPMMIIFIGGSRRITRLSKAIQSRLDNIIDKGYKIPFFDKMNKMNRVNKDHKSCKIQLILSKESA